jgi:hypothetical protein
MAELGERLAARKEELQAMFKACGVSKPKTRSMKGLKLAVGQPFA